MSRSSHFNTARQRSACWDDHHHTTISCWLQKSTPRWVITDHWVFTSCALLCQIKSPVSKNTHLWIRELWDINLPLSVGWCWYQTNEEDQNSVYSICGRTKKTQKNPIRIKALILISLFIVQLLPQRHLQGHSQSWKWGSLGSSVDRRVVDGGWFPRFESVSDTS